ncbi:hypothetical protein A2U01_0069875, partial [Trifolium medium]|nr:hypothetical protein [Trifolium medium]
EHKLEQLAKDKEEKWARDRKNFTDEIAHLRAEAATCKDQLVSLLKERNEAVSQQDSLSKDNAAFEELVEGLQMEVGARYDSEFQFAIEQLKVVFPDLDEAKLG